MTALVMAFYAEGRTDDSFLPVIIQRTAERILSDRGRDVVDVLEPIVLRRGFPSATQKLSERILAAARVAAGYHLLVVHADADHPTAERARRERWLPGYEAVQQARQRGDPVCDYLIPVIPVQMTEAWMLADEDALRGVIGASQPGHELGLPAHPRQAESDPDPKQTLESAVKIARAARLRRRRPIQMSTIYEPLARLMRLDRLATLPAYQAFVDELTLTLVALHMAR